jgi:hypothetical protein
MRRSALLFVSLAAASCATHPVRLDSAADPRSPGQALQAEASLATNTWSHLTPAAFESWLPAVATHPDPTPVELDNLTALAAADTDPTAALRAVLILATLNTEPAAAHLAEQLEARHAHPERHADAADVTAAAYLSSSSFAAPLDIGARLAALAAKDSSAHPDLEVRTECARGALLLGHDEVAPFLLKLTRLGTNLGRERDGDWRSPVTTTWSRDRAAEALAEALDIPCPYHGDSSLAAREAAALALEKTWQAIHEKPPATD